MNSGQKIFLSASNDSLPLAISRFNGLNDNKPQQESITWAQLVAILLKHQRRQKKGGPTWSPTKYLPEKTRLAENVEAICALVIDIDDGIAPELLEPQWQDLEYVIHSSYSHTPAKPKWRAIFPLARAVEPDATWSSTYTRAARKLAGDHFDEKCKDACHMYYLPTAPNGAEVIARRHSGRLLDLTEFESPPLPVVAASAAPPISPHCSAAGQQMLESYLRHSCDGNGDNNGIGLAKRLAGNGFGESEAMALLVEYADRATRNPENPFTRRDAERWWRSAVKSPDPTPWEPVGRPRTDELDGSEFTALPPGGTDAHDMDTNSDVADILARLPEGASLSDLGNARRLAALCGENIRHDHTRGIWYVWSGKRWEPDCTGRVMQLARRLITALHVEAAFSKDENRQRALGKHALKSESRTALANAVALLASEPGIPILPDEFDADPYLLNCSNGTLDLRTGELRPHRRDDLISKLAPVEYDANATHPLWDDLIERVTGGNPEVRAYLQKAAGYSLTGSTQEEKAFALISVGGGGKTTFLEALAAAIGDYAVAAEASTFQSKRYGASGHNEDLAALAGARLVITSELGRGPIAVETFKRATGGDKIRASRKHEHSFEFLPKFALWLASNNTPHADSEDTGVWRRLRCVPWTPIPKDARDPKAKAVLTDPKQAGAAVLAWAVRGCLQWQKDGLGDPPSIVAATDAAQQENDRIALFVSECCVVMPDATVPAGSLRDAYARWCEENGERQVTASAWKQRLTAMGCEYARTKKARMWRGIGLLADAESTPGDEFSTIPSPKGDRVTPGDTPEHIITKKIYAKTDNVKNAVTSCHPVTDSAETEAIEV